MKQFLFLTGFMGAGKSTLGRIISGKLNVPFYDTDAMIEQQSGRSVQSIFDTMGEESFRALENEVLSQLIQNESPGIVSTGGGIILDPSNRKLMRAHGWVIWIDRSPDLLIETLEKERTHRPLLQGADWISNSMATYRARIPLYLQCHERVFNGPQMGSALQRLTDRAANL